MRPLSPPPRRRARRAARPSRRSRRRARRRRRRRCDAPRRASRRGRAASARAPGAGSAAAGAACCGARSPPPLGRLEAGRHVRVGVDRGRAAARASPAAGVSAVVGAPSAPAACPAAGASPASAVRDRLMRRRSPLIVGGERCRRCARTAEYRPGAPRPGAAARPEQRFRARPRRRAPPSGRRRRAPRGRGRRRAGPPPRRPAAARRASAPRPTPRRTRPSIPCSATGWIPTGVPNAGTPHASASITDRPKPSSCDGTSTAFAALIQYGTSVRRDGPQREQRHVPGRLARAVEPLERARRVVREQQVRALRVEAEPRARLGARDRPEALQRDADGQHRDAPPHARARQVAAERARDRGGERAERQRRPRHAPGAAHEEIVAVQRHRRRARAAPPARAARRARSARGRRRTARRHACGAGSSRSRAAARAGRTRTRTPPPPRRAARRSASTWSRTNDAELGRGGGGPHVRDDERSHPPERTFVTASSHFRPERA